MTHKNIISVIANSKTLNVLDNDATGAPPTIISAVDSTGTAGTVDWQAGDLTIKYTPPVGEIAGGTDSFTYTTFNTPLNQTSQPATVSITYTSICELEHVRCVGPSAS